MPRFKIWPFGPLHAWKKIPEYPAILCLDGRTLQKLYQYLPLVDQVCLSLSCKEMFSLFGTTAKHKELEFPRLLLIRNPILCVNSQDVLRNQLLLRLENRRWAYCGKCLKLHPRKEFPRHLLRQPALERSCAQYAGIVDLCPCISLTLRDRDQLVKILKSPTKPQKFKCGEVEYDFIDKGKPGLRHCCKYKSTASLSYSVQVDLLLFLTTTDQLCSLAEHTMSLPARKGYLRAEPSFACPHQNLWYFFSRAKTPRDNRIYQILAISNIPKPHEELLSLAPEKEIMKACLECQTLITT